jgi:dTDP-glucose 4,6-dehydratase
VDRPLPTADLDEILTRTPRLWDDLRGARIFLTGGTGFFGGWLMESLLHADRALGLDARVVVLTRDEAAFRARRPHLAQAPQVVLVRGDARSFAFPAGEFTHVIHAATEASAKLDAERPDEMRGVVVAGTQRALELACSRGARRFLLTSSGAVYGRQRPEMTQLTEDDPGLTAPLQTHSAYAEGKREAERLCFEAASCGLRATIARGFAFVGPYLPLDAHFAIGNFIRDALRGGPIDVKGDGTPYRSYLYGADLAVWLWTILLQGAPGRAYNVGSERRVSVAELARLVAAVVAPATEVSIARAPLPGAAAEQYVPSTRRAHEELGLGETIALEDAICRTADWVRAGGAE